MRVIVAGSTTWDNRESIKNELAQLPSDSVVIHGDSPGADQLGGEVALEVGLTRVLCKKNEDDFKRYKRGAWKGLNERMIESNIGLVLAFHPAVSKSKGTKHLLKLAESAEIPTKVIEE